MFKLQTTIIKNNKNIFAVEGNVRVSLRCVTAGLVSIKPNENPIRLELAWSTFPVNNIREGRLVFDR